MFLCIVLASRVSASTERQIGSAQVGSLNIIADIPKKVQEIEKGEDVTIYTVHKYPDF
jgi:hypothetical protein